MSKRRKKNEGLRFFQNPLAGVPSEVVRAALREMAMRRVAEFPELIASILDILRQKYPPYILATIASYGSTTTVSDDGVSGKTLAKGIEQHHIELLQALVLMLPAAEWGNDPSTGQDTGAVMEDLKTLGTAFHERRILNLKDEATEEQRMTLSLQERLRIHTQAVRNWGYFSKVVEIATELYQPLDGSLAAVHGFKATDLIAVARTLTKHIEQRTTERFQRLVRVFRAKSLRQLVTQYYRQFPDLSGTADEFLNGLPAEVTVEQVKMMIFAHSDLRLVDIATFSVSEIAREICASEEPVSKIFSALSLNIGALAGRDPEFLFLANPVWRAPMIQLDEGYLCPIPHSIFSHIHDIMKGLVDAAGLQRDLEARRAKFLEDKTERTLRVALPAAQVVRNLKWQEGTTWYESDVVARIDTLAIIAEAKSASLTPEGLRGAPDRVKRHVQELILKPSEQSARLEALIQRANAGDESAMVTLKALKIDLSGVEAVIRLSVTLDDFSVLASAELDLKAAKWIPETTQLAPVLNIADLDCVADLLSRPVLFAHYLAERARIQKALDIMADELDLLGFYLETGFNVFGAEEDKVALMLHGASAPLDRYYDSKDAGIHLPKPKANIHPYFDELLARLEQRKTYGWMTIALELLRAADFKEQKRVANKLEEFKRSVAKNWRKPGHICCIILKPPPNRDSLFIFYVYPRALASRRQEFVRNLVDQAFADDGRTRCIVVGRMIESWNDPYSFVYLAVARETPDAEQRIQEPSNVRMIEGS